MCLFGGFVHSVILLVGVALVSVFVVLEIRGHRVVCALPGRHRLSVVLWLGLDLLRLRSSSWPLRFS